MSRTVFSKTFGLDDALMIFALAVVIAYVSVLSAAITAGYGQHTSALSPEQAVRAGYLAVVTSSISVTTFAWPKLAVVALLERLFPLKVWVRALFWTMAISLCGCSLLLSILWYAQCTPRAHQWNPTGVPGSCMPASVVGNLSYFVAAYSALCDLTWALYPPFIIVNLKLPTYKKILLCVTLGGGLVAAVCVFYKITLLTELNAEAKADPLCKYAELHDSPHRLT